MAKHFLHTFKEKRPGWAAVLTGDQYALFRQKLLRSSNSSIDPEQCDKKGIFRHKDIDLNVANLAALCAHQPIENWDTEIDRWTAGLDPSRGWQVPRYPDEVGKLKIQLYPVDYFNGTSDREEYLTRQDMPGVLSTIVVDMPERLVAMTKSALGQWAVHADDTYTKLLSLLKTEQPHTVNFTKLNGSDDVVAVLLSDDVTASNHALVLDTLYPQLLGSSGALVGIPHRHMIIVKKLDDEPSQDLTSRLHRMVQYMVKEQPGFVSDSVFWLKDGQFRRLTR